MPGNLAQLRTAVGNATPLIWDVHWDSDVSDCISARSWFWNDPAQKATLYGLRCKSPLRVNDPGTRGMFTLASGPMFDGSSEVMLWPGTPNSPREPGGAAQKLWTRSWTEMEAKEWVIHTVPVRTPGF